MPLAPSDGCVTIKDFLPSQCFLLQFLHSLPTGAGRTNECFEHSENDHLTTSTLSALLATKVHPVHFCEVSEGQNPTYLAYASTRLYRSPIETCFRALPNPPSLGDLLVIGCEGPMSRSARDLVFVLPQMFVVPFSRANDCPYIILRAILFVISKQIRSVLFSASSFCQFFLRRLFLDPPRLAPRGLRLHRGEGLWSSGGTTRSVSAPEAPEAPHRTAP